MATEIELDPVDFITVGTIGPKGKRTFHLQAGKDNRLISFTIEKEQAWALSEAITDLLQDIEGDIEEEVDLSHLDMELREPIEPLFRIAQMGLSYDESRNLIILIAQEMTTPPEESIEAQPDPRVVRLWASPQQMRALSQHALSTVQAGRPDPKQNGRLVYYWT